MRDVSNVARTIIVLQTTQTSKDSCVFTSRIVKKTTTGQISGAHRSLACMQNIIGCSHFATDYHVVLQRRKKKSVHVIFAHYLLLQPCLMSNYAPN